MSLARPATHPALHAGRRLMGAHLSLLAWFWCIAVAAFVVGTFVLVAVDATHLAIVPWARQAFVWFPFSLEIVVATTYIRAHVAAGMTRRTFVAVALCVAAAVALLNGVLMATMLTLERLAHGWLGWDWTFSDAGFDPSGYSWPLAFLDYGLTFLVGNLCGLLVGIVFYAAGAAWGSKVGAWIGILTIPLTCGPVLAVLGVVAAGGTAGGPDQVFRFLGGVGTATAISLGLAVAVALAFATIARRTAIARART